MTCDYSPTACPDGTVHYTTVATCERGKWVLDEIDCPATTTTVLAGQPLQRDRTTQAPTTYIHSAFGGSTCPTGYSKIADETTCREAGVALGLVFGAAFSS